jgi:SAM-dependent methyltransferase
MDSQQQALNDEGRALWDAKAAFWDALHGDEGNRFHRELISPAVERLLALTPGERVLDVACGSGQMARRLAALGGRVTATDFSPALIDLAKGRGQTAGEPIDYRVVDATDENALVALGDAAISGGAFDAAASFDAVVCTMALMDMPVIAPLFRAARRLLREGGRFVFATSHPAFNSSNPTFVSELADKGGELITTHSMKISAYLDIPPVKGGGAPGEPNPHYYYHRPLHELLDEAFAAGLVLDGIEEPRFLPAEGEVVRPITWMALNQMPPVLVGRLRVGR